MSYEEDFQKEFQKTVDRIADTLENIKDDGFYEFEDKNDEDGHWYFDDIYNFDIVWRMGFGLMGIRIMIACGGPNIWIDTFEKTVHGYWGGDEAISYLTDDCCEKIEKSLVYDVKEMLARDLDD